MIDQKDILSAHILIADKSGSNVLLLEQILAEMGYLNVTSTTDPYSVINLHRANSYDLILFNPHMSAMDGFQLMADLKLSQVNDYLSIVVITALLEEKWQSLAAGAKGFINQPFDRAAINTRIHSLLEESMWIKQRQMSIVAAR